MEEIPSLSHYLDMRPAYVIFSDKLYRRIMTQGVNPRYEQQVAQIRQRYTRLLQRATLVASFEADIEPFYYMEGDFVGHYAIHIYRVQNTGAAN